jgi:hypothetical protein
MSFAHQKAVNARILKENVLRDEKELCKNIVSKLIELDVASRGEKSILYRYEFDANNATPCEDLMLCDKIGLLTSLDSKYDNLLMRIFQCVWDNNYWMVDYYENVTDMEYIALSSIDYINNITNINNGVEVIRLSYSKHMPYVCQYQAVPFGVELNKVGGTELSYTDGDNNIVIIGARSGAGRHYYKGDVPVRHVPRTLLYTDEQGNEIYNKICIYTLQDLLLAIMDP